MDPQATLDELLLSAFRGDQDESIDLLAALLSWKADGGFMPDLSKALDKMQRYIEERTTFT